MLLRAIPPQSVDPSGAREGVHDVQVALRVEGEALDVAVPVAVHGRSGEGVARCRVAVRGDPQDLAVGAGEVLRECAVAGVVARESLVLQLSESEDVGVGISSSNNPGGTGWSTKGYRFSPRSLYQVKRRW